MQQNSKRNTTATAATKKKTALMKTLTTTTTTTTPAKHLEVCRVEFALLGLVLGIAHEPGFLVSPRHRANTHLVWDLELFLLQHASASSQNKNKHIRTRWTRLVCVNVRIASTETSQPQCTSNVPGSQNPPTLSDSTRSRVRVVGLVVLQTSTVSTQRITWSFVWRMMHRVELHYIRERHHRRRHGVASVCGSVETAVTTTKTQIRFLC